MSPEQFVEQQFVDFINKSYLFNDRSNWKRYAVYINVGIQTRFRIYKTEWWATRGAAKNALLKCFAGKLDKGPLDHLIEPNTYGRKRRKNLIQAYSKYIEPFIEIRELGPND